MAEKKVRQGLGRALVTPEGVTLHLRLASAGARAGAFIIDAVIMFSTLFALTLAIALGFWVLGKSYPSIMAIVWLIGFFVLRNFYFVLFESGRRAATIGKRVFKLRVIARDGARLTSSAILARNLMREIEVYLPLTFLAFGSAEGFVDKWTVIVGLAWTCILLFLPLFNRDRLRAGDLIAGTWVVEDERRRLGVDLLADAAPAGASLQFSAEELAAYGQAELQRLEEVLRRDDSDAIVMVAAAIRRKLGRPQGRGDDREFLDAYYAALRLDLERKLLFGKRKRDKFDVAS